MEDSSNARSWFSMAQFMECSKFSNDMAAHAPPIMRALRLCGASEKQLAECSNRYGEDHPNCHLLAFSNGACKSQILAPALYSRLIRCVETAADAWKDCHSHLAEAQANSYAAVEQYFSDISNIGIEDLELLKKIETCQKASRFPDPESASIECVALVACPREKESYKNCVAANARNYEAAVCSDAGLELSRCFAQRGYLLLSMYRSRFT